MIGELDVFPHNLAAGNPLVVGDIVFVVTGNGVDEGHINIPVAAGAELHRGRQEHRQAGLGERARRARRSSTAQWSNPAYGVDQGAAAGDLPGRRRLALLVRAQDRQADLEVRRQPQGRQSTSSAAPAPRNDIIATPVVLRRQGLHRRRPGPRARRGDRPLLGDRRHARTATSPARPWSGTAAARTSTARSRPRRSPTASSTPPTSRASSMPSTPRPASTSGRTTPSPRSGARPSSPTARSTSATRTATCVVLAGGQEEEAARTRSTWAARSTPRRWPRTACSTSTSRSNALARSREGQEQARRSRPLRPSRRGTGKRALMDVLTRGPPLIRQRSPRPARGSTPTCARSSPGTSTPKTGSPFWLERAARPRVRSRASEVARLRRPRSSSATSRTPGCAAGRCGAGFRAGLAGRPVYVFETGGSTGVPKSRVNIEDFQIDYERYSDDAARGRLPARRRLADARPHRSAPAAAGDRAPGAAPRRHLLPRRPRPALGQQADQARPASASSRSTRRTSSSRGSRVLRAHEIRCLFTTPKLLEALCERCRSSSRASAASSAAARR